MPAGRLLIEYLGGPLDGHRVELAGETEWGRSGEGPLAFPWDAELGEPQARFTPREDGWWLERCEAAHATYLVTRGGAAATSPVLLANDDVLKASQTWLFLQLIE